MEIRYHNARRFQQPFVSWPVHVSPSFHIKSLLAVFDHELLEHSLNIFPKSSETNLPPEVLYGSSVNIPLHLMFHWAYTTELPHAYQSHLGVSLYFSNPQTRCFTGSTPLSYLMSIKTILQLTTKALFDFSNPQLDVSWNLYYWAASCSSILAV